MTSSLEEVGNSWTEESRRRKRPAAEGTAVVLGGASRGRGGEGEGEWEARLVEGKGAMGGKGSEAWEGTSRRRRPAGVKKLEDMREAQRDHMLFWAAQISEKALLILII